MKFSEDMITSSHDLHAARVGGEPELVLRNLMVATADNTNAHEADVSPRSLKIRCPDIKMRDNLYMTKKAVENHEQDKSEDEWSTMKTKSLIVI